MARKIYSQLTETIDGDYVHPDIADNTEVDAVIHMGDASGRAWFSFNEENVTVDDSQDAKYGIVIYDAGDADTAAVLGLLTKAQEEAEALGDEKLMDQIGNTITYYTRAHVVKSGGSRTVAENNRFTRRRK